MFVSVCLSMFVCLFDCYNSPVIILAKCLYCYCQFWFCNTTVTFINHHPSFFISFFHPSIEDEKMKFKLSSSGMVYPYLSVVWVNRLSIILFFLFCNVFKFILSNHHWCWRLSSSFIWHHLIMTARDQGM